MDVQYQKKYTIVQGLLAKVWPQSCAAFWPLELRYNLRHFVDQSEVKQNPTVAHSHAFSRFSRQLHVFPRRVWLHCNFGALFNEILLLWDNIFSSIFC